MPLPDAGGRGASLQFESVDSQRTGTPSGVGPPLARRRGRSQRTQRRLRVPDRSFEGICRGIGGVGRIRKEMLPFLPAPGRDRRRRRALDDAFGQTRRQAIYCVGVLSDLDQIGRDKSPLHTLSLYLERVW